MNKINLLIAFGGQSSEHSVSVFSANNIIKAIDKKKYNLILVYIDKFGTWYHLPSDFEINEKLIEKNLKQFHNTYLILKDKKGVLFDIQTKTMLRVDVCFPIFHGLNGEDGSIQGLFKLYGIKFVGSDVLGSCINMDKVIEKRLFKEAGIKTAEFLSFRKHEIKDWSFEKIKKILDLPFFVKPANTGSSVGINKVYNKKEFIDSLNEAFKYEDKVILEKAIKGREIECSILGNTKLIASLPGEIIPKDEFYSYVDKYVKSDGAQLIAPAKLNKFQTKKIQDTALKAYKSLECRGFARVDMFLTLDDEVYLNEINTIPGFTNISMYPRLWGVSGLSYADLIDKLIQLALEA